MLSVAKIKLVDEFSIEYSKNSEIVTFRNIESALSQLHKEEVTAHYGFDFF